MKKMFFIVLVLSCGFIFPAIAGESVVLDSAPNRINDVAALQRGAKLFLKYCLNCHSASLMRYSRLKDLGFSEKKIKENMFFFTEKIDEPMTVAMQMSDAKDWFGSIPPDLSVQARVKGTDWLYTYLRAFYRDDSRSTGWNNVVFPNVGMPNPLWELQGQRAIKNQGKMNSNSMFIQLTPGIMKPGDFDNAVADLVSYLDWMSEPVQRTRKKLGVWVLLFLAIFTLLAFRLNAAYWKDVK
ncbi:cytochrome c1 [Candidatus Pandoraea novymonadis]|uniref:cytochrome c1 n=1 Tax=Candidatus Pandoraea novymonadis TaxID=1808959 RepID=UPI003B84A710